MTQPWATAHVDAELDWSDLDAALVARLEKSTKIAQRVVDKNFAAIEKKAQARFARMGDAFEKQTRRMQRSTAAAVGKINAELRGVGSATIGVDVDQKAVTKAAGKIKAAAKSADTDVKLDVDVNDASVAKASAKIRNAIPAPPPTQPWTGPW